MATIGYVAVSSRREQMKRELIGLVIGTVLLMAGMAFLFSQTIIADSSAGSEPAAAVSVAAPTLVAPPLTVAALDVARNDAAVTPVNAAANVSPAPAAPLAPEEKQLTPEEKPPEAAALVAETPPGRTGWIYGGQFANGKWSEQGLKIGAELPVSGQRYPLAWGATVRSTPPGKRSEAGGKLGKTLANLAAGHEVDIVQVKKSGSKGHVWLEVKLDK